MPSSPTGPVHAPTVPPHGLALDHLVLLTPDPDVDAVRWRDAGFEVSARGEHPTLGTCNRLVMFDGAYIEFLGVARPTDANRGYRERLASGRGCWGPRSATALSCCGGSPASGPRT